MSSYGLPLVVSQAFDDTSLSARDKLVLWHLAKRLDHVDWTTCKLVSLSRSTRLAESTCSESITRLVARGYVEMRPLERRTREFRLPLTRRPREPQTAQNTTAAK